VKALVTGAAGFIGHHLVRGLLEAGHDVVTLDNLSSGNPARVPWLQRETTYVEGDIRSADDVARAVAGCEVVFHEAALASVARSVRDPIETNDVNVAGTLQVMKAAADAGVRRLVFAGSSSVYGSSPELPRVETQTPSPESPYAISKLAAEQYIHAIGRIHGVETVVLRYFNIFGPGQDPLSEYAAVVPAFVTLVLAGRQPTVYGDGYQSRDFTYVANVVSANLKAATARGVSGLTCNIGAAGRYTLRELLAAIGTAAGRDVQPIFAPARTGDVLHSQADIELARRCLGYEVEVSFEQGLQATVEWYRAHASDRDRDDAAG
jgi:UDP-glucose 4-epimerase